MLRSSSIFRRYSSHVTVREALTDAGSIGKKVKVTGWVRSARRQKKLTFLELDDASAGHQTLQCVVEGDLAKTPEVAEAKYHACVAAEGVLREGIGRQKVELACEGVEVVTPCRDASSKPPYPSNPRAKLNPETARNFPQYRAKLRDFAALLRVRSELSAAVHNFFRERSFYLVTTPVLTSNDCEGGGEVFGVKPAIPGDGEGPYFGADVFLTVSGQFHLEAACNGLGNVYNFGPAFRAERGRSRRHLTEFTMIEGEIAFANDLEVVLDCVRDLVRQSVNSVSEKCEEDIGLYRKFNTTKDDLSHEDVLKVIGSEFKVMTYQEAMDILEKKPFQTPAVRGQSLGKEHELYLAEEYCNNAPVFLVDWPSEVKPFYVRSNSRGLTDAVDLILPRIGELVGGSLREHRHDLLRAQMETKLDKNNLSALQFYSDLRLNGAAPTGGFGLGFERLLQFILSVQNIRDTLPFPRTPHSCLL